MKSWIKQSCIWLAKFISFIVISLPRQFQLRMGDLIGILWFDIFRIRRGLVLDNLKLAFPHLSSSQRVSLGRQSLCHMGRTFIEFFYFPFLSSQNIHKYFVFDGLEKLMVAQQKGRGVCLLTCHVGAGDFATAALSLRQLPVHLISKEFKSAWLNRLWFGLRERMGTRFIDARHSSFAILKALRNNEMVIFVQDQFMGPPIGARTYFFGVETGSALGLSVIARKVQAPILPVYTYRQSDGRAVIVVEDELQWEEKQDKETTLVHMTQKFNDKIEEIVRRHPDQWMWVHRRWKKFKY